MTIHEEAALAYMDAAKDCACWRCREAGIRAALDRVVGRLMVAFKEDDLVLLSDRSATARLLHDMRSKP